MLTVKNNANHFNEGAYRNHISGEIIFVTRMVSALGIAMFLSFFIADFWAFSENHTALFFDRLIVSSILGATLLTTFYPSFFEKYSSLILPIPYIVATTGINYMIFLANPSDYASQVYFVGLMLIMMMMFGWSFLKLRVSLTISVFILSLYSYVVLLNGVGKGTILISELLINLAFLISSAIIGFISQLIRDRHLMENFLLQQSLSDALERKTEEAKSQTYLANHDALTDLPNRRYMMEKLEESLQYAKENDRVLVVMYLDLNGFKQVNDIYGHSAGDEVLVIVAKRLELAIRKGDNISRLGGDEYLLSLMMHKDNLDEVDGMIEKFVTLIEQPMNVDGLRMQIGASIGIAAYPMHGNTVDILVDIADKKMYGAKKGNNKREPIDLTGGEKKKEPKPIVIFPGKSTSN